MKQLKQLLKAILPKRVLAAYRRTRRQQAQARNEQKSTQEVFTEIYSGNLWGGEPGDYCSGGGTTDASISQDYVKALRALSEELDLASLRAVDLGCGDMRIGSQIAPLFASYLGVDIVVDLIASHQQRHGSERVTFACLDIIEDELPDAELCIIRQVLQHLSNAQISAILPKLGQYQYVLVTEHLPSPSAVRERNLDKPHGADIRLNDQSGVYLLEPPFDFAATARVIVESPGHAFEGNDDLGIIQTVLYRPEH